AGNTATEENGGPRARVRAQGLSGSVLRALVGGCSASFAISAVDRCSLPHRVDRRKHGSSAEGSTALGIGEGQQYADPSVARVVRVVGHAEVAVGVAAHFDDAVGSDASGEEHAAGAVGAVDGQLPVRVPIGAVLARVGVALED